MKLYIFKFFEAIISLDKLLAGLSSFRFAMSDSIPSTDTLGDSLLLLSVKANSSWFFCRLSLMSRVAYSPFPLTPPGDRSGLHPSPDYYTLC